MFKLLILFVIVWFVLYKTDTTITVYNPKTGLVFVMGSPTITGLDSNKVSK